jgi:phytoene/squalene synthetase
VLHPKYKLPVHCFAYAPDASRPATWKLKLPYRLADGSVDGKRLPKAIQAILSSYRGAKAGGIPEADLRAVLRRLASAASHEGRMPDRLGVASLRIGQRYSEQVFDPTFVLLTPRR